MIELTEATKRYGSTVAVDRLSFEVRPGEVTGFLGPNGAGKTTTLRMLLGLVRPTSGTATVDGFAILAELDSNGDLIIDANDAAWSDLVIWQDADSDAETAPSHHVRGL